MRASWSGWIVRPSALPVQDDRTRSALRQRLRENWPRSGRRFGYRRFGWVGAGEGHALNHKKLYRLYREERLMVRAGAAGVSGNALGTRAPMALPIRDQPALVARLRLGHTERRPAASASYASSTTSAVSAWRPWSTPRFLGGVKKRVVR